jgi:hypothetical protein
MTIDSWWFIYFYARNDSDYSDPDSSEVIFKCVKTGLSKDEAQIWAECVKHQVVDYINWKDSAIRYLADTVFAMTYSSNVIPKEHVQSLESATEELENWIQDKEEANGND